AILLKNFEREFAKEQYRKLPENLKVNKNEDEIVDLSDGHTLSTVLYAQDADRTQVIDELLEVIGNKEEYEALRWYLEAMCVLKKFRENEMLFMIQAYSKTQDEAAQWKINDIRTQVRDRLIKTGLFYWEEGGYKIEDNLRRELRGFLKNDEPENWKALNGAAFDLYKEWAEKFPRFRDHWEEQANAVQNA
ncbi:MAG: hypothetical protein RBT34_11445, partial [Anaerolineaceae bacterium]|nr:hypothetical protein [Anaerolineaceae bacterium]